MLEWVDRDLLVDVSINAVPVVILAYFVVVSVRTLEQGVTRTVVLSHVLTVLPVLVLAFATYHVARAIQFDERR